MPWGQLLETSRFFSAHTAQKCGRIVRKSLCRLNLTRALPLVRYGMRDKRQRTVADCLLSGMGLKDSLHLELQPIS